MRPYRVQLSTVIVNLRPLLSKITWYYTQAGTKTLLSFVTFTIHILLSTEVLTTYMLSIEARLSIATYNMCKILYIYRQVPRFSHFKRGLCDKLLNYPKIN